MRKTMRFRTLSLALAALLVGACDAAPNGPAPAADTASPSHSEPAHKDATAVADANQTSSKPHSDLQPPRPDSVLYFISDKDGDGATSYETVNGSWIHFWYGLQFDLGDKHYYTGFAWETPELYGEDLKNHYPAPGTKVTLAHATFIANPPGSKEPWRWQGTEPYIGEFGGSERGNEVDTTRKAVQQVIAGERLLLAVPTWSLQSGVRVFGYDILVFDPRESQDVNANHWTYLGDVAAGEDNSADCGEDTVANIPCLTQTSTLAIVAHGDGIPDLRVTVSPATAGAKGDATTEYRYDPALKTYRSTSR
jgi:hypothetical protein